MKYHGRNLVSRVSPWRGEDNEARKAVMTRNIDIGRRDFP
jgi:hypothetical protein